MAVSAINNLTQMYWGVVGSPTDGNRQLIIRMSYLQYAGCALPNDTESDNAGFMNITLILYESTGTSDQHFGRFDISYDYLSLPCATAINPFVTAGAQKSFGRIPAQYPALPYVNHISLLSSEGQDLIRSLSGRTVSYVLRTLCLPSPCENGGTCAQANNIDGFTCTCFAQFTGRLCELINVYQFDGTSFSGT